jgi:uncharacterized protein YxjI
MQKNIYDKKEKIIMSYINQFFDQDTYFIDEKVAFLRFINIYKVYDSDGNQLGSVKQSMSIAHKLLSLLITRILLPFTLDIMDTNDNIIATISRGWALFKGSIKLLDENKNLIATIKPKFKLMHPTFNIFSPDETPIASITGDWKAWNFLINDNNGKQIGAITKKWNGILKEAFTTADKYIVSIDPDVTEESKKISIIATAITIDMVLKNSK